MDINTNYSEEENPLTLKSDFILSMCELIVGGKDGLQPVETVSYTHLDVYKRQSFGSSPHNHSKERR